MSGRVPPLVITPRRPGGSRTPYGALVATASARGVARAWEDFAAGANIETGVRPEILASWYRCRDRYAVDHKLDVAPCAREDEAQRVGNNIVYAELGGLGALAGQEVERDGAVVTVTDGKGRVLGAWGDPSVQRRAALNNLAPWSSWAEACAGTNGMGTSLEMPGPVAVTGPEHWCQAFHHWACAGISIRDVATGVPIAAINISRWNASLPRLVSPWLTKAVACVQQELFRRAIYEADTVIAEFSTMRDRRGGLMALDRGGNVIAANDAAIASLGLTRDSPIVAGVTEPAERWTPDIADLPDVVGWARERAQINADWCGYARLAICPGEEAVPLTFRPVVDANLVVGMLCEFGTEEGEAYEQEAGTPVGQLPRSIIAIRDDRLVLLAPSEIRYAEADRNVVWLVTERGRLQAATRGMDNVERSLAPYGIRRVHRRFLVNLRRVAEIGRGARGEMFLITDSRVQELVPVSRRHAADLRRTLGV